jgi:hypothetical protein
MIGSISFSSGQGCPGHRGQQGNGLGDMPAAGVQRAHRRPDGEEREEGRRSGRHASRSRATGRRVPPAGAVMVLRDRLEQYLVGLNVNRRVMVLGI